MNGRCFFWGLFVVWLIADVFGFILGYHQGTEEGVRLAHAENNIRVEEHDRIMQRVGICKWAKIMAEDIRCKTELP